MIANDALPKMEKEEEEVEVEQEVWKTTCAMFGAGNRCGLRKDMRTG